MLTETVELDPPRRTTVSRRMFALVIVLVVVMMSASDIAIILIAPSGPTAATVRKQIRHELVVRSAVRDTQFCAVLAAEPRTAKSDRLRRKLRCNAALHPKTTTTGETPPIVVVNPKPTATVTVTHTMRPKPRATVTVPAPCKGVRVDGGCLPTKVPSIAPSLPLP